VSYRKVALLVWQKLFDFFSTAPHLAYLAHELLHEYFHSHVRFMVLMKRRTGAITDKLVVCRELVEWGKISDIKCADI
jgi:hypothetical protein